MPSARLSLLLVLAAVSRTLSAEVKEPRTGIGFADKGLQRLGVRTKGPIKVYAVGEYADGTYVLKMSYGVGAQKMTSALADALKPRCSDAKAIEAFEDCLVKGLPDGAPKGTKLEFSTVGSLGVSVNGKKVGTIGSKPLASAFAGIYCDKNAVCAMNVVGAEGESASGSCITPMKGAAVGAAVGYGLGKFLS